VTVMGEPAAGSLAVLDRGEQGAGEQCEAVRVLVVGGDVAHQVEQVAADLLQAVAALQDEAVGSGDPQVDLRGPQVVEAIVLIEQPDEGPERARSVVVLGLAEQEGAASLEVTQ